MATRRAAAIFDENLIQQGDAQAVKKTVFTSTATRRPALGNLLNRTDKSRVLVDKKAAAQTGSNENFHAGTVDLKNVKARVDTHWKNGPLLRNNSVKKSSLTGTAVASVQSGPKLVKAKTSETAILKEAKLVDKTDRSAVLKRQDSTLTRRRVVSGTSKLSDPTKRAVTRTKSNDSAETAQPKVTSKVPVFNSRFRPPSVSSSYSNGLLSGFADLNIDEGDEENTLLVCEYVNDIYAYLFEMEQKYAIRKNHLDTQSEVNARMRTVLLDWLSEVHMQYHFAQETFHITVSTIDRYLQAVRTTSRKNLQLVGVAALFIASKYEELYPPDVQDFVYITDNTYTKEQILTMEKHMLKKLKFEMGAPTAIHFLRRFSKAAQSDPATHNLSKYFIELAAIDYSLSEYLPSEIAAAALFTSLCVMHSLTSDKKINNATLWNPVLEFYTTYNMAHLRPIIKELVQYVLIAPTSKTNNVYTKYCSQKQGEIAVTCEKSKHILKEIIEQE